MHGPTLSLEGAEEGIRLHCGPCLHTGNSKKEKVMGLGTILLIVLILVLLGVIPTWPHSRSWGYAPSGVVGVVVIIIIVLLLMGRL